MNTHDIILTPQPNGLEQPAFICLDCLIIYRINSEVILAGAKRCLCGAELFEIPNSTSQMLLLPEDDIYD